MLKQIPPSDIQIRPFKAYKEWSFNQSSNEIDILIASSSVDTPAYDLFDYLEAEIGTQNWMAKNLDVTHYRNGDIIPQATTINELENATTGMWCYYNFNSANGTTYGKLYNWYAVNDSRGLAPQSWRIPTNEDWSILQNYIPNTLYGGHSLESKNWSGGTDIFGFNALPAGWYSDSVFAELGTTAVFWSYDYFDNSYSYAPYLQNNYFIIDSYYDKKSAYSVRCIRDVNYEIEFTKKTLWHQLKAQFYKDNEDNPFLRSGRKTNVYDTSSDTKERYLGNDSVVISIPNTYIGEGIKPGSLIIDVISEGQTMYSFKDDKYSNLICTTNNIDVPVESGHIYTYTYTEDFGNIGNTTPYAFLGNNNSVLYLNLWSSNNTAVEITNELLTYTTGSTDTTGYYVLITVPGTNTYSLYRILNVNDESNTDTRVSYNLEYISGNGTFTDGDTIHICFDINMSNSSTPRGNVFYNQGLIVFTKNYKNGFNYSEGTPALQTGINVSYKSTMTIYEHEYLLVVKEDEFNISQNPSACVVIGEESEMFTDSNNVTQKVVSYPGIKYICKRTELDDGQVLDFRYSSSWYTPLDYVQIGTQVWASKNLNVTNYRNGDPIPYIDNPTDWAAATYGAWTYRHNIQSSDGTWPAITTPDEYGKWYNWYAVNDPRGLAPSGWHVSTTEDWNILTGSVGTNPSGKLKEAGTSHWISPNTTTANTYGFNALPAGTVTGSYGGTHWDNDTIGKYTAFWTTAEVTSGGSGAYIRAFSNTNGSTLSYATNAFKWHGNSVRVVYDKLNQLPPDEGSCYGGFEQIDLSGSIDRTGSFLAPFVTSIGLYDDSGDLVAVAKLPQPIKILPDYPMNFIVRFDT